MIDHQKVFGSSGRRLALVRVAFILLLLSVSLARAGEPNRWTGTETSSSPPMIGISREDDKYRWIEVQLLGTRGLISGGQVNRDGIGTEVKFTPEDGLTVSQPILGDPGDVARDSLGTYFDLGSADRGMVEVIWPSGVRNRLYEVYHAEQILFPEIPCNFAGKWDSTRVYQLCVHDALDELETIGLVRSDQFNRFLASALKAFREEQGLDVNYSARSGEQALEVTPSVLCPMRFNPMGIVADHPAYWMSNDGAHCY